MKRPVSVRQTLANAIGVAGAVAIVAVGYLWFVLLSPYGYTMPAGLASIDTTRTHRVFAYGTLEYAPIRWVVIGRAATPQPAALPGFRVDGLNVVRDVAAQAAGVVFEVTAAELLALDRYERRGVRYERVDLRLDDGEAAWVYRRLPCSKARTSAEPTAEGH